MASPVANEAFSLAKSVAIEVVVYAIFGSNNPSDVPKGSHHDTRRTYWNWYVPVTDEKNRLDWIAEICGNRRSIFTLIRGLYITLEARFKIYSEFE